MHRVDRNDIRMLQSGESIGLHRFPGRNFQHHDPVGQIELLREINRPECTTTELLPQVEVFKDRIRFREIRSP